jgi:bacterioferritin
MPIRFLAVNTGLGQRLEGLLGRGCAFGFVAQGRAAKMDPRIQIVPTPGGVITKGEAMQGDPKVIDALNGALTAELTAINQYFIHAKMCANWGYHRLAKKHRDESMDEMKHAESLIERILFLEGTPEIARYSVIRVGTDVKAQLENDLNAEREALKLYNESIATCVAASDAGSRELFEQLIEDEEGHLNWLETQLRLIEAVGMDNYLTEQMGSDE